MAVDTGHGATITLGTTGGTWLCRQIDGPEINRPLVDKTYLGTTNRRAKMAGDLDELGSVVARFLFQGSQGLPATDTAPQTVTITHPLAVGNTTPANLAGTALVHRTKYPTFQTNEMQESEFEVTFDGTTLTYTPAS